MVKRILFYLLIVFSTQKSSAQTVNLLAPNGFENWAVSSVQAIQWAYSGVNFVKIEYSIDGGLNYNTIVGNELASNQIFFWTIPFTISSNCIVKISDTFSGVSSQSQNSFSISTGPYINLTSLNGGEILQANSDYLITWYNDFISGQIKLEYSIDDGTTWILIVDSLNNTNSYLWNVPNNPSNVCRIRISDASDNSVFDVSNFTFYITIPPPPIELFSPNGGEQWAIGFQQNIFWSATTISFVKIEVSYDSAATWNIIEATYPGTDGFYTWTVAAPFATTNALIKISDAFDNSIFDISNNVFELIIPPAELNLMYPNGGELVATGLPINITWNQIGINNLLIEYSVNNGLSWTVIDANANATLGTYTWNVPNVTSDSVLIRLSDVTNSSNTDQSVSSFSIVNPSLSFQNFPVGSSYEIFNNINLTWTHIGLNNQLLKLEYTKNDGITWLPIASNIVNTGSYLWLIDCLPTDSCRIKISLQNNPSIFAISPGAISIISLSPAIVILSPTSQATLGAGNTYPIKWFSYAINYVRIEFSMNGDTIFNLITPLAPANNGVYYWQIPSNLNALNCKLKISNAANTGLNTTTPYVFNIGLGNIQILSGNTPSNLVAGTNHQINWIAEGTSNYVNIEYSLDSTNWLPIINNYNNSGVYNWTVPFYSTSTLWYRIKDANNSSILDVNNQPLSINIGTPFLQITQPFNGAIFVVNSTTNISWNSGGVNAINIEYSIDGGNNWITIATNINATTNSYSWNLPAAPISNGILKISDASIPLLFNQINFNTSAPTISLTSPIGGENWNTNNYHYITWQSVGVNYVNLLYSDNNGNSWQVIDTNLLNIGNYNWLTPSTIGSNYKIKIENSDLLTMFDESNLSFNLAAQTQSITLVSPNGGEVFTSGSGVYIDWISNGISAIDIYYSINGGTSYLPIATNIPSYPAYYYWQVPDTISNSVKIKINKSGNSSVADISNANFSIISNESSLELITPNGGELYNSNSFQLIRWNAVNTNFVKLYYSTDGGLTYNFINSILGDTSFVWNIPNNASTTCLFKIISGIDTSINDVSNSTFEIINLAAGTQTITIDSLASNTICSGSSFNLNYIVSSTFNATNHFSVHLSNSSGNFNTFTVIGETTSINSGSINCTIPNAIINSDNYNIRIVSDNPTVVSTPYAYGLIKVSNTSAEFNSDKVLAMLPNANVLMTPISNSSIINTSNWLINNNPISNAYAPQVPFNLPGKYNVTHQINDTLGCTSTVSKIKLITVEHLFYTNKLYVAQQNELIDIGFENEKYGCAIFKDGNCVITSDSGKTWALAYTNNSSVQMNSISIFNGVWYIALEDGSYLKSIDKGNTWNNLGFNNTYGLNQIYFISNSNAYALGQNGKLYRFNGTIWQNQISGTTESLNKMCVKNSTKIIVGNNATILKLQNNAWTSITAPVNTNFYDVTFKDSLTGYIVSDFGYILKTIDAGLNWNLVLSGADVSFQSIACSGDSVWAVGTNGAVFTSTNNGISWNRFNIGTLDNLNSIVYFKNKGFIAGANGLLRNFDNSEYKPFVDQTKEISKKLNIQCYPNPTNNYITLNFGSQQKNVPVKIYDIEGRLIWQNIIAEVNVLGQYTMNLSAFKQGIYFVHVNVESETNTFKIIKN